MPRCYKEPTFQRMYDALLAAARDCSSELYVAPRYADRGRGLPRRGAGHRCAFWDGFNGGRSPVNIPGTMSAVCYRAGADFAKEIQRWA